MCSTSRSRVDPEHVQQLLLLLGVLLLLLLGVLLLLLLGVLLLLLLGVLLLLLLGVLLLLLLLSKLLRGNSGSHIITCRKLPVLPVLLL
jgi:hypothetical protein